MHQLTSPDKPESTKTFVTFIHAAAACYALQTCSPNLSPSHHLNSIWPNALR